MSKNPQPCGICAPTENLNVVQIVHHATGQTSDGRVLCRRCLIVYRELEQAEKIQFKGDCHHSRWATLKFVVKQELELGMTNMFSAGT